MFFFHHTPVPDAASSFDRSSSFAQVLHIKYLLSVRVSGQVQQGQ